MYFQQDYDIIIARGDSMSYFHKRLDELKEERGETQTNIAKALGISPQTLSYYFNGREPNYDLLCKIAEYFDVSTDYLLGMDNYRTEKERKFANTISDGHAEDIPDVTQGEAAKIYSNILECLYVNQKIFETAKPTEKGYPAQLNNDLIYNLTQIIEAYTSVAEYLESEIPFMGTSNKFRELIDKVDFLRTIEHIAYYYDISERPYIKQVGKKEGADNGECPKN